jgi:tetratricopeptide (TPR) repeat protein
MTLRIATCSFALAGLLLSGCDSTPRRPDVLIVSIDRLDWSAMAVAGGPVATPRLEALASDATIFEGLVSPSPGGAPAALTLLSGLAPSQHGLRRLEGPPRTLRLPTLGDSFRSRGWQSGGFSQAPLFGGLVDLTSGFDAWMMPDEAIPLGLPRARGMKPANATAGEAQHWLRGLLAQEPALAWVHFEDPVAEGANELEAATRLAELDALIGHLIDQVEQRGAVRGARPVVVVLNLAAGDLDAAFVLDESAVRVRAIARVPGLEPGVVAGLAGVDELHDLLAGVADSGTGSRLRDLAAGGGVARDAVIVETQLPMATLGAQPLLRAIRAPGVASPAPDPQVMQALGGDSGWPGGFSGPSADSLLPEWRELMAAASELAGGAGPAAERRLGALTRAAGPRARSAALLLSLSEAADGRTEPARTRLTELVAGASSSGPGRRQAALALAEVERGSGQVQAAREILQALTRQNPDDLTALLQLGIACEQAGDPAAALETLSRASASRPGDARVLTTVASVHASQGRPDLAALALRDALLQRPVDGHLLLAASEASLDAGDPWTALTHLNRHQEIFGTRADTLHRMGLVYHRERRWASATTFHGRALDEDDSFAPARFALADSLLRSGHEDDGRAILTVASARALDSAQPCRILAAWLLDEGRGADARSELESCLARHPGDPGLQALARAAQGP